MEPRANFRSLSPELQWYILSFLPWQDVLRCSSVCTALRQTYLSSSELQYIVELGGQRLLPVPTTGLGNQISIAKRLQLLRDKAHAWFGFNKCSFETLSIPEELAFAKLSVAGGHLSLWDQEDDLAEIFPILPKPSQRTIKREWSPRSSHSVPNAQTFDVFVDPAQNLVAAAYFASTDDRQFSNENFYIDLRTLDIDGVHPQAAGPILSLSALPESENDGFSVMMSLELKGLGKHIALRMICGTGNSTSQDTFVLQIWDWQHSTTSSSILSERTDEEDSIDFCFLGNDRLIIAGTELKLYSIEDISQPPRLLACFLLPFQVQSMYCHQVRADDALHNSDPQMQAEQTMWISDPKHRLLCIVVGLSISHVVFVISTGIFFNLGVFGGMRAATPWENWGPPNTRAFQHPLGRPWNTGVHGNRVIHSFPPVGTLDKRLRMMDFSPLAVERRQSLGRVVKEPSTVEMIESGDRLTTSLPYVEVVSDRSFRIGELRGMWIDRDKIILLTFQLEVIEV